MQKIFIEKPYQFVRPVMGEWLPWIMNNRLVHKPLLWFTESIVSVESRGVQLLRDSVNAGHAIMMIGNHPRVSDPVVIYDLIRRANTTMFAMASWHLFNQSWFNTAVIRLYGAYSVNREGLDRESINFSIAAMQNNTRPLLVFPEGATSRTNGSLMPFLDGPTFIARTAAKRRHKQGLKTVIHPVAVRYFFMGDFKTELERIMQPVEQLLGMPSGSNTDPAERVEKALKALVAKKEREFEVESAENLTPWDRRLQLANKVLTTAERRWLGAASEKNITNRIRDIRSQVFPEMLVRKDMDESERAIRWKDLKATYLAWQMASYPENYLADQAGPDRILEIAAKIHEDLTDQPRKCGKQRVVIEVCEPIEVPPEKFRGQGQDPLTQAVEQALMSRLPSKPTH